MNAAETSTTGTPPSFVGRDLLAIVRYPLGGHRGLLILGGGADASGKSWSPFAGS
jgi:hypothetical protein